MEDSLWAGLTDSHAGLPMGMTAENLADKVILLSLAVRYGMVPYGTVRYSTVRYVTVRYGTVRYGTTSYGTVRCGTVRYSTVRYDTRVLLACARGWNEGAEQFSGRYACHGAEIPTDSNTRRKHEVTSIMLCRGVRILTVSTPDTLRLSDVTGNRVEHQAWFIVFVSRCTSAGSGID